MAALSIRVNGKKISKEVSDNTLLSDFLRDKLSLTGTHVGCDTSQCGACVVHLNGNSVKSCTTLAADCDGSEITTIEGLAEGDRLSALQQAFIEEGAAQCGYCTAGLLVAATALLEKNSEPDDREIRGALQDHLCRCGSHLRVLKAIDRVIHRGA